MSTFQLDQNNVSLGIPSLGTAQVFTVTNSSVQSTAFGETPQWFACLVLWVTVIFKLAHPQLRAPQHHQ